MMWMVPAKSRFPAKRATCCRLAMCRFHDRSPARTRRDADLRTRLGQTGRERFTDQFRHQTMTRRIREVYQEILESSGTFPPCPPGN